MKRLEGCVVCYCVYCIFICICLVYYCVCCVLDSIIWLLLKIEPSRVNPKLSLIETVFVFFLVFVLFSSALTLPEPWQPDQIIH